MRGFLKTRFPRMWAFARGTKDRLRIEYYLLRRMKWHRLLTGSLNGGGSWDRVLPYQSVRRIPIPDADFDSIESMREGIGRDGGKVSEGTFTLYLPPETVGCTVFRALKGAYPPDAGVKILKTPGPVGVSTYGPGLTRKSVDRHLLLAANLLHVQGVAPRVYDLVELACGSQVWTAYVMQHVEGREPTVTECEAGVAKIRDLEQQRLLMTVADNAFAGIDFMPPTCNGNAIIDGEGRFQYIDFQHFVLGDYAKYLEDIARQAADDSHFGEPRLLGKGRFLYQAIPGVRFAAKRSVEDRSELYTRLLRTADVTVRDRLVLDVGCNIGMMMAEYLKWGAKWCHGWDFPNVVPHTERLLLALGCTRFSTMGGALHPERRLEDEVPSWLRDSMKGCVVSYLAVHGHIGWLPALARIPWSFLIYEGHEKDTPGDVEKYLRDFGKLADFDVRAIATSEDGASRCRQAAILVRRNAT